MQRQWITTDGDSRMHGSKSKLHKHSGVLAVIALVISSLYSIAAPSALAVTPAAPGNLVMCKSLKTTYQYVSTTGTCNNKIYETIKWYKKGTAPTGTPGSKLISLNTCQSKTTVGAIVLKAKCNIKTETTFLWQRPLGPPAAPTIKSVLPGKLGTAEIEYIAPENNGGARVLSYKALSNPGGFTATVQKESSGKIIVAGLHPGTKYTFTVLATNSVGTSLASSSSLEMFAPTTANAPIIKSVEISGPDDAKITFTAPDFDGGTPITDYEVITHPYADITHSVTSAGIIDLSGLAPGTEYTFTLIACNSAGDSEQSNTSNLVRTPVPVPAPDPVPVQSGGGTPSLTSQTLTIDAASFTSTYAINAAAPTLTSTSSGGTGAKSYSSSTLAVCTINSSTGAVVFVAPGTCTVTASIAADSTYSSATSSSVSFTITLATQVLTWAPGTSLTIAQSPHTPSTLASGSGSPAITYAVTSAGTTGCTVNASTAVITYTGAGSCTITATAAATSIYASATKSVVFSIEQIEQAVSITSTAPVAAKVAGSTYALTATGGASGNPVTFASLTILICTVSGSTASFIGVGTCTISADQAGNTNYSASPQVTQSFTVGKGDPQLSIFADISKSFGASAFSLTAPTVANSLAGAFSYTSGTTATATISSSTVTIVAAGTSTITATFTPTDTTNYNTATIALTLTVLKRAISLTAGVFSSESPGTYYGSPVVVNKYISLSSGLLAGSDAIPGGFNSGVTYTILGTGSTAYGPSTSAPTAVGTYLITPSAVIFTSGAASNYEITYIAKTWNISYGATFTSFSFNKPPNDALSISITEASGKVQISNSSSSITVIFLPGADRTSLVPTFTLDTGATVTLGGVTQTSGVTSNNYTSNVTYIVTSQDGSTTKTYTLKVGSAALSTSSMIKGQSPLVLGTPSTTLASASGGSVSISLAQAADVSNAGSYVTSFATVDSEDALMRVVKYAAGADYTGFETATVYANSAITSGDFFIVKVKSASTITILYYKITVTVPSKVAISRASVGTSRGTAFTTQPQITIQDSASNTVIASSALVTATVSAGGTLVGTTTATASSGVATFTGLGVDGTIGTTYTITYTSVGLTVATATVTLTGISCDGTTFTCRVGDIGPGGGKIFYVAPTTFTQLGATGSMCSTACKYLEAASTSNIYAWSGNTSVAIGATAQGTAIGTGYANTLAIVGQADGGATAGKAGTISRAYSGSNALTDWFLPSKDELNELYLQRAIVGGFFNNAYWSSSESGASIAWSQLFFATGIQSSSDKSDATLDVRPVRAF